MEFAHCESCHRSAAWRAYRRGTVIEGQHGIPGYSSFAASSEMPRTNKRIGNPPMSCHVDGYGALSHRGRPKTADSVRKRHFLLRIP